MKYILICLFNIPKYKQYSKKYIIELINYLHIRRFILDTYSYSGWGIFNKQIIIKKMDEYIALDTINCKKKSSFNATINKF